ncbi:MAG: sugar ABC transporter permease [Acidimicrobiaceae bacterium]|nr:sugar ABC transporter permease [Acidimicrobiaceae bacterium]
MNLTTLSSSSEQIPQAQKSRLRDIRRAATPYMLVAPVLIFLGFFFAYPMYEGLRLAIWDDQAVLPLREGPSLKESESGRLSQGVTVDVLQRQGNLLEDADATDLLTETWFRVAVTQPDGSTVDGWAPESRIRVREESADGTPLTATVRPKLGEPDDPRTTLRDSPGEGGTEIAFVEARAPAAIVEVAILEVWFKVRGTAPGESAQGWAPSRFIQVFGDEVTGRIDRGSAGEFTTDFIKKMFNDRFFSPAWRTTLLLLVLIIPAQFVLALLMSLVIHARLKFNSWFLYVFTIPMGMSDLAVGTLFFSIFTGNGLLNSVLEGLGIIDSPHVFLSSQTRNWIILAIVVAEIWRSTSIVMVILVSGLQAIPDENLEAAELFGASYWQRVRYVMLPLLKPSVQVALILRTILALQVFAVVIALGGGDTVTVLTNETFRQYADFRNNNVAAAYAVFVMVLSLASAFFYLRTVRTDTEIER